MNDKKNVFQKNIPKIFHFIWINFKQPGEDQIIPIDYQKNISTWMKYHKDYQFCIWKDSSIQNLFNLYKKEIKDVNRSQLFYETVTPRVLAVDFIRLFIIHIFGGTYLDIDTQCYKSMDSLIKNEKMIVLSNSSKKWFVNNWLISTYPNNPLIEEYMERIMQRYKSSWFLSKSHLGPLYISGPLCFSKTLMNSTYEVKDIKFLSKKEREEFCHHECSGSWTLGNCLLWDGLYIVILSLLVFLLYKLIF